MYLSIYIESTCAQNISLRTKLGIFGPQCFTEVRSVSFKAQQTGRIQVNSPKVAAPQKFSVKYWPALLTKDRLESLSKKQKKGSCVGAYHFLVFLQNRWEIILQNGHRSQRRKNGTFLVIIKTRISNKPLKNRIFFSMKLAWTQSKQRVRFQQYHNLTAYIKR